MISYFSLENFEVLTRFRDINVITIIVAGNRPLYTVDWNYDYFPRLYSLLIDLPNRITSCRLFAERKMSFQVDLHVGERAWVSQPRGLSIGIT